MCDELGRQDVDRWMVLLAERAVDRGVHFVCACVLFVTCDVSYIFCLDPSLRVGLQIVSFRVLRTIR